MYTGREAVDLGLEIPSWLTDTAQQAFEAARAAILARGGQAIVETPEGQAAVREEVKKRVLQRAGQVARAAAPIGLPIILGLGALFLLSRRR